MTTVINRDEALQCTHPVTPYRWLKRNLTVTRQGECGMFSVMFVQEPGFDGESLGDVRVFSEVNDNGSKNEMDNGTL